jgi:hypothetical protein
MYGRRESQINEEDREKRPFMEENYGGGGH